MERFDEKVDVNTYNDSTALQEELGQAASFTIKQDQYNNINININNRRKEEFNIRETSV